jgi:hypothetical protein
MKLKIMATRRTDRTPSTKVNAQLCIAVSFPNSRENGSDVSSIGWRIR